MSTPAPTYTRTTVSQGTDQRVVQYAFTDGRVVRETLHYRTGRLTYSLDGQRLPNKAAMDLLTSHAETTEGHAAPADSTPSMPDTPAYQVTTWDQHGAMTQLLEQVATATRQVTKALRQVEGQVQTARDQLSSAVTYLDLPGESLTRAAEYLAARDAAVQAALLMFGADSPHLQHAMTGSASAMRLYSNWGTYRLGWES